MRERFFKIVAWATSRQGRHDIGSALGALAAIYTALHKAGAL